MSATYAEKGRLGRLESGLVDTLLSVDEGIALAPGVPDEDKHYAREALRTVLESLNFDLHQSQGIVLTPNERRFDSHELDGVASGAYPYFVPFRTWDEVSHLFTPEP